MRRRDVSALRDTATATTHVKLPKPLVIQLCQWNLVPLEPEAEFRHQLVLHGHDIGAGDHRDHDLIVHDQIVALDQ